LPSAPVDGLFIIDTLAHRKRPAPSTMPKTSTGGVDLRGVEPAADFRISLRAFCLHDTWADCPAPVAELIMVAAVSLSSGPRRTGCTSERLNFAPSRKWRCCSSGFSRRWCGRLNYLSNHANDEA